MTASSYLGPVPPSVPLPVAADGEGLPLPSALSLDVLGGLPEQWPELTRNQQGTATRALAEIRHWLSVIETVRAGGVP